MSGNNSAGFLVNLEINNSCAFTAACGESCVLEMRKVPGREVMSSDSLSCATSEVLSLGNQVCQLVLAGKEPMESPDFMFEKVLKPWHASQPNKRAAAVGIITSGVALKKHFDRFVETPLSWCLVSVDDSIVGLRTSQAGSIAIRNATRLRDLGGANEVCANTIWGGSWDSIEQIGERLESEGFSQWAVGPYLEPKDGVIKPVWTTDDALVLANRLVERFGDSPMGVAIDVPGDSFFEIASRLPGEVETCFGWRLEQQIPGSSIKLVTLNCGSFLRLRWDGLLMDAEETLAVNLSNSKLGFYRPGAIRTWAGFVTG